MTRSQARLSITPASGHSVTKRLLEEVEGPQPTIVLGLVSIEASRGAGEQGVTINVIGCGFCSHLRKLYI